MGLHSCSLARGFEVGGEQETQHSQDLENLVGADFSGRDLAGRDFSETKLAGANFENANLRGAIFRGADLSGAEFFMADLEGADLRDCVAPNAGFAHANLTGANMFSARLSGSTFANALLLSADLRAAELEGTRFNAADLRRANFVKASLNRADLCGARVGGACFEEADLHGATVEGLRGYEKASWVRASIVGMDFRGAYAIRQFVIDQNFLDEYRHRSRANTVLYWLWWLTSDCGRSLSRWGGFTLILAVLFGLGYQNVGIDMGDNATPLSPYYFSVVTLTTLGYGDVVPTTSAGQALVMLQVIVGYLMLGGLISIFANKMARRGA